MLGVTCSAAHTSPRGFRPLSPDGPARRGTNRVASHAWCLKPLVNRLSASDSSAAISTMVQVPSQPLRYVSGITSIAHRHRPSLACMAGPSEPRHQRAEARGPAHWSPHASRAALLQVGEVAHTGKPDGCSAMSGAGSHEALAGTSAADSKYASAQAPATQVVLTLCASSICN